MKIKEKPNLLIFITSIFIGMLVVFNTNLEDFSKNLNLSAVEYKDAIEEKNSLYEEIGALKEQNNEMSKKITGYKEGEEQFPKIIEDMNKQVQLYTLFTGQKTVEGPGIVIKITDGDVDLLMDTQLEIMSKIFHDNDMALLLNEVKNAGAETMAINSHRVIDNTGVICNWAFIGFEDNSMESAPFYVYAIGDPDSLYEAIFREGSHLNKLIIRKLNVEVEKKDLIVIPSSTNINETKYMKRYENN